MVKVLEARKRYDEAVAARQRLADAQDLESDAATAQAAAHALRLAQEAETAALQEYQRVMLRVAVEQEGPL